MVPSSVDPGNKRWLPGALNTEREVVRVYDMLPHIIWTQQFLCEQGCCIRCKVVYQDNMSLILLEKNGCSLSTKQTKHMDIKYFYVTNHLQNKTLEVQHCPTQDVSQLLHQSTSGHTLSLPTCSHHGTCVSYQLMITQECVDVEQF